MVFIRLYNVLEVIHREFSLIQFFLTGMPGDASADKQCDVVVSVNEQSVTKSDSYTFAIDKTPTVTSISPERGGTQGGTSVTITGTLFSSEPNDVYMLYH